MKLYAEQDILDLITDNLRCLERDKVRAVKQVYARQQSTCHMLALERFRFYRYYFWLKFTLFAQIMITVTSMYH